MLFRRFLNDRGASVVPMFGILAIPAVGLIGASIDYSRASAARTVLQAAVDSTALAMAQGAASLSAADLSSQACNHLMGEIKASHYFVSPPAAACPAGSGQASGGTQGSGASQTTTGSLAGVPTVNVSYSTTGGSQVVVTASSSMPTLFLRIPGIGIQSIPFSTSSTAIWGNKRLRVALVLDNTGSMSEGGSGTPSSPNKIQALQTASHNLLAQLQKASTTPGDIYVSIVPFTKDVNVDPSNSTASWIDWTDWDAANGTCSKSKYSSQSSCQRNGGTWKAADHSTWNGCVTDRDQNYDTMNTTPTTGSTLFPAEQYSVCPVSLIAQTYDWTALNNKIDAMVAAGNTNQPIGLAWGWQSLTSGTPLNAPPLDPNYQYQNIVILLTDGLNTQNRWTSTQSAIDARQKILCDNMRNAGVTIYTIQVDTDNEPTSSVLKYCAGSAAGVADASKFFLLTQPSEIVTTFNTIGVGLNQLRLAR